MDAEKNSALIHELALKTLDSRMKAPTVIAAPPGWRVVVEAAPDESSPHGTMVIADVAVFVLDESGQLHPAIMDTVPLLATANGRIRAIIPPGSSWPLVQNSDLETVDLPAPNEQVRHDA